MRFFIKLSCILLSAFCAFFIGLYCIIPAFADFDDNALEEIIDGFEIVDIIPDEVTYEQHDPIDIDVGDIVPSDISDSGIVDPDLVAQIIDIIEARDAALEDDALSDPPMVLYAAPAPNGLSGDIYLDVPDNPPSDAPFYGQWYIHGYDGRTEVTIYTSTNEGWGVDANGYLVRLGGSATGQCYLGTTLYTSRFNGYSYPQYRTTSTASQYNDIHLVVDASNINIYRQFPVKDNSFGFSVPDYVFLFSAGLIIVLLLIRKR